MKNKYLLDTNILIYYFNGITNDKSIDKILSNSFNISVITKIEFLGWQGLILDQNLKKQAELFLSQSTTYELSNAITDQTIIIRQKYKIKTPDAIIAATAMINGFDLVSNNYEDFKNLDLPLKIIQLKTS